MVSLFSPLNILAKQSDPCPLAKRVDFLLTQGLETVPSICLNDNVVRWITVMQFMSIQGLWSTFISSITGLWC